MPRLHSAPVRDAMARRLFIPGVHAWYVAAEGRWMFHMLFCT